MVPVRPPGPDRNSTSTSSRMPKKVKEPRQRPSMDKAASGVAVEVGTAGVGVGRDVGVGGAVASAWGLAGPSEWGWAAGWG